MSSEQDGTNQRTREAIILSDSANRTPFPGPTQEHDEATGKARQPFKPREMLQRIERLLSQTRSPRQGQAGESFTGTRRS